jgi:prohibitin 1
MRERVSKEIKDSLQKRALEYSIHLDDVSITDLQFAPEFAAAIEQK